MKLHRTYQPDFTYRERSDGAGKHRDPEVAKRTFDWVQGSKVINVFVLALSLILTVAVFTAYWQAKQMAITWYIIAAFIIIGFLVAYAAMFGYDKLLSYFKKEG